MAVFKLACPIHNNRISRTQGSDSGHLANLAESLSIKQLRSVLGKHVLAQ